MIVVRQPNSCVVEVSGHSTSQICASVSTIVCMLNNLLEKFNEVGYYNDNGDRVRICISDTETSHNIMDVAIECLKDLVEQYPDNIKFEQNKRHD